MYMAYGVMHSGRTPRGEWNIFPKVIMPAELTRLVPLVSTSHSHAQPCHVWRVKNDGVSMLSAHVCHPQGVDSSIVTCECIICQMLSWWTKKSLHSIKIWDTATKVLPLCSVYQAPTYESTLTLLAPFPTQLAYLSMLFISRINSMLKIAKSGRCHVRNVRL